MRVAWAHYFGPDQALQGHARGWFSTAYFLYHALKERGVEVLDLARGERSHARQVLHVCPPHYFSPAPGKVNVLFTMIESTTSGAEDRLRLASADRIIWPSTFCAKAGETSGLDVERFYRVPLGVSPAFIRDRSPFVYGRRPRVLWVGSRSARKGWELIAPAWNLAFGAEPGPELYLKVSRENSDREDGVREEFEGSVKIDNRDLSTQEMADLYASADVFLFPSFAEGFGLPALEAMAAGCLVVSTDAGGLEEFVGPESAVVIRRSKGVKVKYGPITWDTQIPTPQDVASALRWAVLSLGTREAELLRLTGHARARGMTWLDTADGVIQALRDAALAPARAGRDLDADRVARLRRLASTIAP